MAILALLVIVLLIIIGFYDNKCKRLETENRKLKREIEANNIRERMAQAKTASTEVPKTTVIIPEKVTVNEDAVQATPNEGVYEKANVVNPQPQYTEEELKAKLAEENRERRVKQEADERSKKNTTILVTGAILIVLAAIAFLLSAWEAIPDIIKTAIIVLLSAVFIGASKIANEKYGLEKTSKTFFYIGMAYIPICLISISIFGLLGTYFSISGDGAMVYLALSSLVTSCIYLYYYKIRKDKILFFGSILAQLAAVILFTMVSETRSDLILAGVFAYDVLLILYGFYNREKCVEELRNIVQLITIIGSILAVTIFGDITVFTYITLILIAVSYGLLYGLVNKQKFYIYVLNGLIYFVGLLFISNNLTELESDLKHILVILYTAFIFIAESAVTQNADARKSSLIFANLVTIGLYFSAISVDNQLIRAIVAIVEMVYLVIGYKDGSKTAREICGVLIPINVYSIIQPILMYYTVTDAAIYFAICVTVVVVYEALSRIYKDEKYNFLKLCSLIITNVVLLAAYVSAVGLSDGDNTKILIYHFSMLLINLYNAIRYHKYYFFKYYSYLIATNILYRFFTLGQATDATLALVPVIAGLVIAFVEYNVQQIRDNFSTVFVLIFSGIAFGISSVNIKEVGLVLDFILAGYLIFENVRNDENNFFRILPELALIGILESSNANNTFVFLVEIASVFLLTIVTAKERKVTFDTLFTGIIILLTFNSIANVYVNCLVLLAWTMFTSYFIDDQKGRDLLKTFGYISVGVLYSNFVDDSFGNDLISIKAIGLITLFLIYDRFIIRKYVSTSTGDLIEYLVFGIIYWYMIFNYNSFGDGVLFSIYLVGIVMLSYVRGYGAIFMITIAAILLNGYGLTKSFWSSIPSYLYILVLGGILVAFASKNEMNEKANKQKLTDRIKSIKSNIDKNGQD